MPESIKLLLIVKVEKGLRILDTPRPLGKGAVERRAEPVGKGLYAYGIHNIGGVEYARLVPQNPLKPEWVRVAEADRSIEYVDVINLDDEDGTSNLMQTLIQCLEELAVANTLLANALRNIQSSE